MTNSTETSPSLTRSQSLLQRAQLLENRSKSADEADAKEMARIAANLRALAKLREQTNG